MIKTLGGAKFCHTGRERIGLVTDADLWIQIFCNRSSFFLKFQSHYAKISHNFSDMHQKGPKNTGIGPWPRYREQLQNLDSINITNPESHRHSFENEENTLYIGVKRKSMFCLQLSVPWCLEWMNVKSHTVPALCAFALPVHQVSTCVNLLSCKYNITLTLWLNLSSHMRDYRLL